MTAVRRPQSPSHTTRWAAGPGPGLPLRVCVLPRLSPPVPSWREAAARERCRCGRQTCHREGGVVFAAVTARGGRSGRDMSCVPRRPSAHSVATVSTRQYSVVRAPIELKGSARQRHVGHVAALISHALALSVRCGAQGRMRRANDVRHRASWVRTPDSVQTRPHGTSGGRSCSPSLGPATEKIRAEMSRPCFTSELCLPLSCSLSLEALPSTGRDG
jgi:hypothetical protein